MSLPVVLIMTPNLNGARNRAERVLQAALGERGLIDHALNSGEVKLC